MKFDEKHYVPVLKLKRGEKSALSLLSSKVRARITPLFEIVERKKDEKDITAHLNTSFARLSDAVGTHRYFLDCREIESEGPEPEAPLVREASQDEQR